MGNAGSRPTSWEATPNVTLHTAMGSCVTGPCHGVGEQRAAGFLPGDGLRRARHCAILDTELDCLQHWPQVSLLGHNDEGGLLVKDRRGNAGC